MQNHNAPLDEEKPLDPEMEKVRKKMVRLLGVSLGIMFIGVMAVLAAVVYKIRSNDDTPQMVDGGATTQLAVPTDTSLAQKIDLPPEFAVMNVSLDGDRVAFYGLAADGLEHLLIADLYSGNIIADIIAAQQ